MGKSRRAGLVLVAALACVVRPAGWAYAAETLPPLPRADFENFLPAVREQLREAYAAVQSHPQSSTANGALGMVLHAYNVLEAGEVCYRRAHLLDLKSFRWLYYLGTVLVSQGRYDESADILRRALLLSPEYAPAKIALAESLLALARWEESGRIYESVLRSTPDNAAAHYGLGRVRAAHRDWKGAMEAYVKACDLFPNYGAAHYALALAYRKLGDEQRAREQFALYEKNRAIVPPSVDSLMAEVRALNHNGLEQVRLGLLLEKAGKLRESAAVHEKALGIDPGLVQAHINLISLYGRLGDAGKAEEHFQAAIRISPNSAEAYYDHGVLLMGQKKYPEAEQDFRKTLEINPFHPEAHNNLGSILERQGKRAEAEAEFRKAIENKTDYRLAHFHLGRILVNRGGYAEGIQHLLKTITPEDDQTPGYLYALGAAYARAGQYERALRYIREAREKAEALGQTRLLGSIDRDLQLLKREGVAH